MDHSFCVCSHLYGLFKILFNLIQCWLWVGCGLVFQMGFPYIPDNAVQIIMKNMAVKIVLLYLTQFQRPHIQIIFSRCVFFKNALPGSFQNQIHLVHPHAVMNEQEKRQVMESLISEIQIYPERQENGQWLKSIKFKLPIIEEDMNISLDNDTHIESVALLSKL